VVGAQWILQWLSAVDPDVSVSQATLEIGRASPTEFAIPAESIFHSVRDMGKACGKLTHGLSRIALYSVALAGASKSGRRGTNCTIVRRGFVDAAVATHN
jgi:hypothetical protein